MERRIGGKACLEQSLIVLEPQISMDINKLRNKQQILLDLSNTKNSSKSMTLKNF